MELKIVGKQPLSKAAQKHMKGLVRDAVEAAIKQAATGTKPPPATHAVDKALHSIAVAALEAASSAKYTANQLAKALCEGESLANVAFWVMVRDGKIEGVEVGDMLRASENLANRGGLPPMTQTEIKGDTLGRKLFDFTGPQPGVPVTGADPEAKSKPVADAEKAG